MHDSALHFARSPRRREPAAPGITSLPCPARALLVSCVMDALYIGLTVGFFAVSLALVELFDRL